MNRGAQSPRKPPEKEGRTTPTGTRVQRHDFPFPIENSAQEALAEIAKVKQISGSGASVG
jgi:hypothetical protein